MAFLRVFAGRRLECERQTRLPSGLLALVLVIFGQLEAWAQNGPIPEYQVKAVFLFNFAQFVTWPSPESPDAPLVIGILGDDPFGSYLDETVRGEKVNNRLLTIQRFRRGSEARNCNILFISQSERDRVPQILSSCKGRNVLTVSDIDGFTDLGGMIQFFTEKNKVRMRINLNAVKATNLKVSSKLLRVAEVGH
jgi:YfiR/HmsC-like